MQVLGYGSLAEQRGAGVVAYLMARARHPKQLVYTDQSEQLEPPHPPDQRGSRQRLDPPSPSALRCQRAGGERPRGRLEDVPIFRVTVRQYVLDVVGQVPHFLLADEIDRRRRHRLVVVVDQLQHRLFDVARGESSGSRCPDGPFLQAGYPRGPASADAVSGSPGCCPDTPAPRRGPAGHRARPPTAWRRCPSTGTATPTACRSGRPCAWSSLRAPVPARRPSASWPGRRGCKCSPSRL